MLPVYDDTWSHHAITHTQRGYTSSLLPANSSLLHSMITCTMGLLPPGPRHVITHHITCLAGAPMNLPPLWIPCMITLKSQSLEESRWRGSEPRTYWLSSIPVAPLHHWCRRLICQKYLQQDQSMEKDLHNQGENVKIKITGQWCGVEARTYSPSSSPVAHLRPWPRRLIWICQKWQ